MRFSLSSSHALPEMKCDMQVSYEMVSNAHVHHLTVKERDKDHKDVRALASTIALLELNLSFIIIQV